MSTLVLMRHGQASFGAARYDVLSATGQMQARATGQWFRSLGLQPHAILHGPRERQAETARLFLEESAFQHVQPTGLPVLDEFAEGEDILNAAKQFLSGQVLSGNLPPTRDSVLRHYDATCRAWSEGRVQIQGRVGLEDFCNPLRQWLREHTASHHPAGQYVVAVTSAGTIAALVCEVLGLPSTSWYGLLRVIRNASLTEILYSKGRCSLLSFNSTGHLPAHLTTSL